MNAIVLIVAPLLAGLFALLGAYVGAGLSRRNEHEKWLRERRSEAYATFLERLSDAHKAATDALYDGALEELQRDIRITELYLPAMDYVRVVCLYLPKNKRDEFRDLAHGYFVLHSQKSLGDSRLTNMGKKLTAIQELFEETL